MIRFTPGFDGNGNPTMNPDPNGAWAPYAHVAELEAENAELKQWLEEARGNTSAWSSPPNY